MTEENNHHYRSLESMYLAAPINKTFFRPEIEVNEKSATITVVARPDFHHSAHAVHGSVYFKSLDDAAFFAANSIEPETFVLTAKFTTELLRPVVDGILIATGKVEKIEGKKIYASALLHDEKNNLIGKGEGLFVRSNLLLADADGYKK